ncbi:hypothetical protein [Nocardioides albus]|uniref:Uncharacterized protein n=1 Tax=Nocardioides albus TaxID=1841 RepID=A0A7W5A2N2_9ACTN|nr:hypothetical protein [Nocardioides albus]MBB3088552.1 hypothetical protein [Nocardioides albus]GGU17091.1 hypothetical protein GCM10007979_14420 [Nocardioides albus]
MTKNTLSPRMAKAKADYINGGTLSRNEVINIYFEEILDEWRAERAAKEQAVLLAEMDSWTTEIADFVVAVLEDADGLGIPRAAVITTDPEQIKDGNPAVLVKRHGPVEHTGYGHASGGVWLEFYGGVEPTRKALKSLFESRTTRKVGLFTVPSLKYQGKDFKQPGLGFSSDGWILSKPFIAHPSAAGLARVLGQSLDSMGQSYDPATGAFVETLGVYVQHEIGVSEVASIDGDTAVLRGRLAVHSRSSHPSVVPFSINELSEKAERECAEITKRGGFVQNVGFVQDAKVTKTEPFQIEEANGKAFGVSVEFEVTATASYGTE